MKDRFLLIGTIVWTVATMLLLVFFPDLSSALWIFMSGVEFAFLAFAVVLVVTALIHIRRSPGIAAICALIILGTLAFAFTGGLEWGERTRFALVRRSYEH